MILMLQPEQISAFWPAIKHAVSIACKWPSEKQLELSNRVLVQLLTGKAQCWVGVEDKSDGQRSVSGLGVTTLEETPLGEKYLYLHSLYAFTPIPESTLQEIIPTLEQFCKASGYTRMIAYTNNTRLKEYFTSQGFVQEPAVYVKDV